MKKCCQELLKDIKSYIALQGEMYKKTRRWSVGLAMEILVSDLELKYEMEVIESKANDSK